jgi:hypothetical protein
MPDNDPFSSSEFDPWASTYDKDVSAQSQFPFDGYDQVLETVVRLAAPTAGMSVLDIGTGTGNLALRFARRGCELWCADFSEAMLSKAREKIPRGHFVLHDLRGAMPAELIAGLTASSPLMCSTISNLIRRQKSSGNSPPVNWRRMGSSSLQTYHLPTGKRWMITPIRLGINGKKNPTGSWTKLSRRFRRRA